MKKAKLRVQNKKNILMVWFAVSFFLLNSALYAQSSGAYLIPRQIFIGDPATLVVPLPASGQNENIFINDAESLPQDPNIDFNLIVLERRTTGSRLMIEFMVFTTGSITLPVIEIGGEKFEGLSITVNSLMDNNMPHALSGAAAALAMPGTAAMLYGSMAALVFFILAAVWFLLKGRTVLKKLREIWKRRRLFNTMRNIEKRLQRALSRGLDRRKILDRLSEEFRDFLSILSGNNCRSMTAREFFNGITLDFSQESDYQENALFLGNFFQKCDELRFSGVNIDSQEITDLLDNFKSFIDTAEKPKEKHTEEAKN